MRLKKSIRIVHKKIFTNKKITFSSSFRAPFNLKELKAEGRRFLEATWCSIAEISSGCWLPHWRRFCLSCNDGMLQGCNGAFLLKGKGWFELNLPKCKKVSNGNSGVNAGLMAPVSMKDIGAIFLFLFRRWQFLLKEEETSSKTSLGECVESYEIWFFRMVPCLSMYAIKDR